MEREKGAKPDDLLKSLGGGIPTDLPLRKSSWLPARVK